MPCSFEHENLDVLDSVQSSWVSRGQEKTKACQSWLRGGAAYMNSLGLCIAYTNRPLSERT